MPRAPRLPIPRGHDAINVASEPPELPSVLHLGLAQVGPAWEQRPHRHDFHELGFIRRGQGEIDQDGHRAKVEASSMYWLPPGQAHGGVTDARDPLQILYIGLRLPPALATRLDARLGLGAIPEQARYAPLRHALAALHDVLLRAGQAAVGGRLLSVLAHLVALGEDEVLAGGTPRQRALAEEALRRLDLCVASPPSLTAMARALGVGSDHLGQAVRTATGTTWPRLVAAARLRMAQRLLADEHRPMREIARAVGLSGERALARLVRRETGAPPRALRG